MTWEWALHLIGVPLLLIWVWRAGRYVGRGEGARWGGVYGVRPNLDPPPRRE
jgi:hypothetical protein